MKNLQNDRREYGKRELREEMLLSNPFAQFEVWLKEALETELLDPTAMVLATVDEENRPDTRVVLLKQFDQHGLVFFTHYQSPKAIQAEKIGMVALNFYWSKLARQIRIRGSIEKISQEESQAYFSSRSRESQLCAVASQQSATLISREDLEKRMQEIDQHYQDKPIPCPDYWGGYRVLPIEFEFFQGRDNRVHDRIHYAQKQDRWEIKRLSP